MKEFLLNKKYVGLFVALIYVLILSVRSTNFTIEALHEVAPIVSQEADYFLPITLKNGEIVEPQNKIISRSYGANNRVFNVVLNTQLDEFPSTYLEYEGIYLSRKYLYAVSAQKTEVRKLDDMPDFYVDSERFKAGVQLLEEKADKFLFFGMLAMAIIFVSIAVLFYTLVIHWLMSLIYQAKFSQTLRINTLAYVAIGVMELILPFNLGIITTILLLAVINAAFHSLLKEEAKQAPKEEIAVVVQKQQEKELKQSKEKKQKPARAGKTQKKSPVKKSVKSKTSKKTTPKKS